MAAKVQSGDTFRSTTKLARILNGMVTAEIVLTAILMVVTVLVGQKAIAEIDTSDAGLSAPSMIYAAATGLQAFFLIVCQLTFVFYLERVRSNLPALGVHNADTKNWQCLFGFLIPIYNLFKPIRMVKEIWAASSPNQLDPLGWKAVSAPKFITYWWIAFIINTFIDKTCSGGEGRAGYVNPFVPGLLVGLTALIVGLVFTRRIVRQIAAMQEEKHAKFAAMCSNADPVETNR